MMGNLRKGHLVEAGLWLGLCLFLYIFSFEFDKPIEIYKFGASAWPRAIILLIAIAALGQLYHQWKYGDQASSQMLGAATDDNSEEAAHEAHHDTLKWYLSTLGLLAIPFIYMRVPDWIAAGMDLEKTGLHVTRIVIAAILLAIVVYFVRHHRVRVALMLPLFFASLMEDFGFYALAPLFIIGVMYVFGERRPKHMAVITAVLMGVLLLLFVKILFVGLPVGNIRPFYDFGSWVVTVLQ
jgi:C4-dicarboxylate transporter